MKTALKPDETRAVSEAGRGVAPPLLAAVLVMVTVLIIPNAPLDLKVDADTSSSAVLNYAEQQGLQFGTDLVYLYGPLGHLLYFYFSPDTAVARLLVNTVFCFVVAAGLCLAAWRLGLVGRCLLVGLFVFLAANADPRTDLLIDSGLLCWGLLCFVENGRRLVVAVAVFVALAALGSLAKVLVLLIGGVSVLLIAGDLATRGYLRLAAGMVAGFVLAVVVGWVGLGQRLGNLGDWLASSLAVAHGYSQSLGWEGLPQAKFAGLAVALMGVAMVLTRAWTAFEEPGERFGWRRGLLLAWLAALVFLTWKHGFGRGDSFHVVYFFGFMAVLAVALEVLPSSRLVARHWARGLGMACCLLSVITLQSLYYPTGLRSVAHPYRLFRYHARCLLKPAEYWQRMGGILEKKRDEARLPLLRSIIGRGSVDVFGQHPVHALLNDLNYCPRPVFQSYVACNAQLMRLNEEFYFSSSAPLFVMFTLGPIDRRFPPLEDAMLLRQLLFSYELAGAEGDFLLLRKASVRAPQSRLLREGTAPRGERIDLSAFAGTNLWLEIELEPTWLGRLRQLLYQSSTVRLAAWGEGPKPLLARRRAPATMLAAGFVASPLLLRNDDAAAWYNGEPRCRPSGYSIELPPGDERFWHSTIRWRVFETSRREEPLG
ncbi:MAG TPA: hypothetical protein P5205_12720 [Candidatus Paceibacterota bacterium]|nr:hypothetical protein [Verrucomicrobiota bacterium]HSA11223.1 hypothetical protein [Candidatus Paceibacterota bacterium]